ncbi:P2X purinoceptor 1 isoform X7 [Homo sapiens]|uniref:P2X purinoceptor 1 isoform X7 n=1 Tax=Homo sapiens TaxID=9606 RepID=UPI0005CFF26F|nr:P2X purinoceptor 1 isoform X7 [Homo sapiens]XP_047292116.1 P2X purinoceptor 1 isoform X7 [Homo sapiens]XP_054172270.1 P2X purinoceptor 1 isoform X7 [Homo sapiens]XP_054172271.1 P2X purinoceptor 1 isoform X7 [Homo sapiens]|eukprot:XP_011522202.1 P2X purinoceptor 1 isoform X6 [Homo sapiens]
MSGGGQRLVLVPGMIVPFWASPDLSHRAGSAESEAAWDAPAVWLSREPRQAWQRLAHLWVFLYEKGYQTSSGLISSVSVKLKGLAVTQLPGLGPQVWDVADYVFPAQGDNSFVVMTNFIVTPKQTQGYCAEHPEGGICKEDSGCTPGKAKRKAQGIRTGKCVAFNDTVKTCEIFGWCPVEVDDDIPRLKIPLGPGHARAHPPLHQPRAAGGSRRLGPPPAVPSSVWDTQGASWGGAVSACGVLQPCPSPRGRELHSFHQEQHQLSTLQGQQAQPGGGGECCPHEDLPLSQDPAPPVPSLPAWLRGARVRPELQHPG